MGKSRIVREAGTLEWWCYEHHTAASILTAAIIAAEMLDTNKSVGKIEYNEVSADTFELEVKPALAEGDAISAVGHPDTAAVLGVPMNRMNVRINEGDSLCLCQLQGGRLPEGATTLPEGFEFKYFMVHVKYGL